MHILLSGFDAGTCCYKIGAAACTHTAPLMQNAFHMTSGMALFGLIMSPFMTHVQPANCQRPAFLSLQAAMVLGYQQSIYQTDNI